MFLVTCGALTCLKKTHYQAADHQGGEAPRDPAVLTRVGLQILTEHHNSVQRAAPNLKVPVLWDWDLYMHRKIKGKQQVNRNGFTSSVVAVLAIFGPKAGKTETPNNGIFCVKTA